MSKQSAQTRIADKIGGAQPEYNFKLTRYVMCSNMSTPMNESISTTAKAQQPSTDFWEAPTLRCVRTWASASIDLGIVRGSVTNELLVGTPYSKEGKGTGLVYVIVRHWMGASRTNTLSLAQYSSAKGLLVDGVDVAKAFRENAASGLRGLKGFLINLLDFGTEQTELVSEPLPRGNSEACCVVVEGEGWAAEGGASNNNVLPTHLKIQYVDFVVSYDLLVFYQSLYLWEFMKNNLKGGDFRKITDKELQQVIRRSPTSPHPTMNVWYEFVQKHPDRIKDRSWPMADPRDQRFRFQLDKSHMSYLYGKMISYL